MTTPMDVEVPIFVERWGGTLYRARSFPPLKVDVVSDSLKDLRRRLQQQIRREVRQLAPTAWITGRVWKDIQHQLVTVELTPPNRRAEWVAPFSFKIDTFRIPLEGDQYSLYAPLLDVMVIGKDAQLQTQEIQSQLQAAIDRMLNRQELHSVLQRLDRRRFSYRTLRISLERAKRISSSPDRKNQTKTPTLRSIAIQLQNSPLGSEIYGLEDRVAELKNRLMEEVKPSLLLVGPSGIGKTSMVHRLGYTWNQEGFHDRPLWTTAGARIVSGMSGLGMWQQRVQKILHELRDTDGILHVGNLIELMEAGKIQGQPGVASMLRHAIASGRIQVIAEATPEQIGWIEREDPLLLRAFVSWELPVPSTDFVLHILRQASQRRFTEEAIVELQHLFRRFATYSTLPAPALQLMRSLLDETPLDQNIAPQDVTRAFSAQTGLPEFLLDDETPIQLESIRQTLSNHVIGQPEPIDIIVNLLATFKARLSRADRPLASLLFIGPTGVGKTEMAKAVAEIMYHDANRMIRIDMSEYANPWSTIRLLGRPGEGDGTLVSPIREQPFSVVLLDEFEKADPSVFELLLQLLGEGRLTDAQGRLADFRNAIIIMTSNLGVESFRAHGMGFGDSASSIREHFERELRQFVRPELLGRIDRLVPFQPLSLPVVQQIVSREMAAVNRRPGLKDNGVTLQVSPAAIEQLAKLGYEPRYGARPIRRAIEKEIVLPLAKQWEREFPKGLQTVRVDWTGDRFDWKLESLSQDALRQPDAYVQKLNQCRELRLKAMLSLRSDDYRRLINELERNRRMQHLLEKRWKATQDSKKIQLLREQLGNLQKIHHDLDAQRLALHDLVERIQQLDHRLTMAWYEDQLAQEASSFDLLATYEEQLRNAIQPLQGQGRRQADDATIIVLGKDCKRSTLLWKSYLQLAQRQQWKIDVLALMPYEPQRDEASAVYRKRSTRGQAPPPLPDSLEPASLRLLGVRDENGNLPKLLDVHPIREGTSLENLPQTLAGYAFRLRGSGAANWLAEENGVHHFIMEGRTGPSKRLRFRVDVTDRPLAVWDPPPQWKEIPSLPERDPVRTYHFGFQTITDHLHETTFTFDEGEEVDRLTDWIQELRELAIWRSIGFRKPEASVRFGAQEDLDDVLIETIEVPY